MGRQIQNLEFNAFVKGFITEAGPLTFPENATIAEQNFVLNKDGSRNRRLGMDYEDDYVKRVSSEVSPLNGLAIQTYVWKNVGGDSGKEFLVIQIGSEISFFDNTQTSVSNNLIQTFTDASKSYVPASFSTVNGILVVATGEYEISSYEYTLDNVIVQKTFTLRVRDTFGVEDLEDVTNTDLRQGQGISLRPTVLTNAHTYNLRNQSFSAPRRGSSTIVLDTISAFYTANGKFPSNADSVNYALYPDSQNTENRLVERFFPKDLADNPPGNFAATNGAFVIDILKRGTSRLTALQELETNYPEIVYGSITIPEDYTEDGATVVKEYAGRVFYAGFNDGVTDGDSHSPRLGNHILFSQVVKNQADLSKCYQDADPTSNVFSDLVATDGGLIRLEGAFNIQKMEVISNTLIVFAQNGVWAVSGGSDYGFEATNYRVDKIADHGLINPSTVVNVDNSLVYWGLSGIYSIGPDQYGKIAAQNITSATIQKFYEDISPLQKVSARGVYDSYRRQVRWLYNTNLSSGGETYELILDVGLGAFFIYKIGTLTTGLPKPVALFRTPAFREGVEDDPVVVSGEPVEVLGEAVVVKRVVQQSQLSEIKYLTVTSLSPLTYTVSFYGDQTYTDWVTENGTGVDAYAYMITGWTTLGDTQRQKTNPYIHFHLRKSEIGFTEVGGELYPINPSSCIVQAQWEWNNSDKGGRWSTPFQAYRHKRLFQPTSSSDTFDDGNSVVTTKNKFRGYGRALSLLISTEPKKDCQLLGWSQLVTVETDV